MSSREFQLCQYCNKRVPRKSFGIHKVDCARRRSFATTTEAHCGQARLMKNQKVRFENFHDSCESELPGVITNEREKYCGSKTNVCKTCGSCVMVGDFVRHLESCKNENPSLLCEFSFQVFPGNKLLVHQKKCFNDQKRFDESSIPNVDIGEALGRSGKNKASKTSQYHDCSKQSRGKRNEVQQEMVGLRARNEETGRKLPKSHRESISIIALPCEICGELYPSDKLMQHQMECQQEIVNTNDLKIAQQTSHRGHGSVFTSRDSQQTADVRYIEVYRGYSPTLKFEDDSAESLERNVALDVFSRGERSAPEFSFPPVGSETYQTCGDADVSSPRHIEIQRSYSPVMHFEDEHNPGIP